MRIEVRDYNGWVYAIDSENPVTLSLWLYEYAQRIMRNNIALFADIRVYPRSQAEQAMIGRDPIVQVTAEGMGKLIEGLREWQFWLEAEKQ